MNSYKDFKVKINMVNIGFITDNFGGGVWIVTWQKDGKRD